MARVLAVLVALLLIAPTRAADDPKPARKPDPTAAMLEKLREPSKVAGNERATLATFAEMIGREHGLPVLLNEEAFKVAGMDHAGEAEVKLPAAKGLRLNTVIRHVLNQHGATFLVRKDHLEFLPVDAAAREVKLPQDPDGLARLTEPLVSVVVREKPLNEVIEYLAEEFDLNVAVGLQAGDNRMGFVTARLLNVPAPKALELLAVQADLRVVRKGNTYLITSKDHANELFNEHMDRERQKAELEKLKNGTTPPPEPAPAPAPAPPPVAKN